MNHHDPFLDIPAPRTRYAADQFYADRFTWLSKTPNWHGPFTEAVCNPNTIDLQQRRDNYEVIELSHILGRFCYTDRDLLLTKLYSTIRRLVPIQREEEAVLRQNDPDLLFRTIHHADTLRARQNAEIIGTFLPLHFFDSSDEDLQLTELEPTPPLQQSMVMEQTASLSLTPTLPIPSHSNGNRLGATIPRFAKLWLHSAPN